MKKILWHCSALAVLLVAHGPAALAHWPDQAPHQIAHLGEFQFEGGGTVPDLKMSYVTHGKLNAAKDNAILFMHGFGANHHGFDHLIGPGRPLDTDKYFIICPDELGNTQTTFEHSTSPTNSGLKMKFPFYNGRDMVRAQHKLITEALGIPHLLAVTGLSSGADHSVQFAVSYPDFMDGIFPVVGGTPSTDSGSTHRFLDAIDHRVLRGMEQGQLRREPEGLCVERALRAAAVFLYTRLVGAPHRHARGLPELAQPVGRLLPRHSGCAGSVLPNHGRRTGLARRYTGLQWRSERRAALDQGQDDVHPKPAGPVLSAAARRNLRRRPSRMRASFGSIRLPAT